MEKMIFNGEFDLLIDRFIESKNVLRQMSNYKFEDCKKLFVHIGKRLNKGVYDVDKGNEYVIDNIIHWLLCEPFIANNPHEMINPNSTIIGDINKGLYIAGQTGTGKTLMTKIINILSQSLDIRYLSGNINHPFSFALVDADAITDTYLHTGDITKYKHMHLLCIQDLGREPAEVTYMGTKCDVLRSVIESRADNDVMTIITSNLPFTSDVFEERYGDRVVSRLHQMCNYFILNYRDYRKK